MNAHEHYTEQARMALGLEAIEVLRELHQWFRMYHEYVPAAEHIEQLVEARNAATNLLARIDQLNSPAPVGLPSSLPDPVGSQVAGEPNTPNGRQA